MSVDAGGAVFEANIKRSDAIYSRDIIHHCGGGLTSLVGFGTTPVPGAPGSLFYLNDIVSPVFRDGEVLSYGQAQSFWQSFSAVPAPGPTTR